MTPAPQVGAGLPGQPAAATEGWSETRLVPEARAPVARPGPARTEAHPSCLGDTSRFK